jgi:hypothetical protein
MRFNYTKGQYANYMVSIHREIGEDFYYFHYFKEAKEFFDTAKTRETKGTSLSLWDMKKDIRKDYERIGG